MLLTEKCPPVGLQTVRNEDMELKFEKAEMQQPRRIKHHFSKAISESLLCSKMLAQAQNQMMEYISTFFPPSIVYASFSWASYVPFLLHYFLKFIHTSDYCMLHCIWSSSHFPLICNRITTAQEGCASNRVCGLAVDLLICYQIILILISAL